MTIHIHTSFNFNRNAIKEMEERLYYNEAIAIKNINNHSNKRRSHAFVFYLRSMTRKFVLHHSPVSNFV